MNPSPPTSYHYPEWSTHFGWALSVIPILIFVISGVGVIFHRFGQYNSLTTSFKTRLWMALTWSVQPGKMLRLEDDADKMMHQQQYPHVPTSKYFSGVSILKRGGKRDAERKEAAAKAAAAAAATNTAERDGRGRSPFGGLGTAKNPIPSDEMLYLGVGRRNYGYNSSSDVGSTCSSNLSPRCRSPDRCARPMDERSARMPQSPIMSREHRQQQQDDRYHSRQRTPSPRSTSSGK